MSPEEPEARGDALLFEAVRGMAAALPPAPIPIRECVRELIDSQRVDENGVPRSLEQRLTMMAAAYAAALRIIQQSELFNT